ncbi:MAG: hypothetical protein A2277_05250 [Desulfobacterales bacterium RIFOXYA12_FULL_46_15]|nr:MAG: hypothetical protein A2097_10155 [Desulfobacula sp. GWF2_41_7]OGR25409.1 MAG: hypothetical protein A2277_05250 [Desulfobacterales bacterium RIFOXYA12_FULL_46_15]
MEPQKIEKARCLINETRVMTLAVCRNDIPWSSPVYFVFHGNGFYFFSNENSRHIKDAEDPRPVSASIFQDSDRMDLIFGFQMSGRIEIVSKMDLHLRIVKKYVSKFSFLKQIFGPRIIENRNFFLEKFKSRLYCFRPYTVFLSDNSGSSGKRSEIDLTTLC